MWDDRSITFIWQNSSRCGSWSDWFKISTFLLTSFFFFKLLLFYSSWIFISFFFFLIVKEIFFNYWIFFSWPHPVACGILILWPGIQPNAEPVLQWKCRILTTGLPGKFPSQHFFDLHFVSSLLNFYFEIIPDVQIHWHNTTEFPVPRVNIFGNQIPISNAKKWALTNANALNKAIVAEPVSWSGSPGGLCGSHCALRPISPGAPRVTPSSTRGSDVRPCRCTAASWACWSEAWPAWSSWPSPSSPSFTKGQGSDAQGCQPEAEMPLDPPFASAAQCSLGLFSFSLALPPASCVTLLFSIPLPPHGSVTLLCAPSVPRVSCDSTHIPWL